MNLAGEQAAREAIERYFAGHRTGDPETMRRAFHPEARVQFVQNGTYGSWDLSEYLTRLSGAPAPDEDRRIRVVRDLRVTGNIALAEVELDYPHVRFVDYLCLLRLGEEWTITHKVFKAYPKDGA
jgi:hypothetical protein